MFSAVWLLSPIVGARLAVGGSSRRYMYVAGTYQTAVEPGVEG